MPYITKTLRRIIDKPLAPLVGTLLAWRNNEHDSGLVVYTIFRLLVALYAKGPFTIKAEALKVLEAVKLEYYRRVLAPYEDEKIKEEGDIDGL